MAQSQKEKEHERLVEDFWTYSKNERQNWFNRKDRAMDFYKGDQWDKEDIKTLDEQKRPHLTFNYIKSIVRNIVGYQRRNRQETKINARKGGTAILAEIFTEVVNYYEGLSTAIWGKAFAFFYGIIGGKGFISIDVDYTEDPFNGDVIIDVEDTNSIYEDPDNKKYDLNKGRFVFKTEWQTKEKLEEEYPDVEFSTLDELVPGSERRPIRGSGDEYRAGQKGETIQPEKFNYLVRECWWKSYEKKRILVDRQSLTVYEIPTTAWSKFKTRIKLLSKRFAFVERTMPVLHLTTSVGKLTLQDVEDPLKGLTKFPIVRFVPDFIEGYCRGEVEDLEGPQEEANKRPSQALHHLSQSANSGWTHSSDAFDGPGTSNAEDLEQFGSMPGVRISYKKGAELDRIEPVTISQGHLALDQLGIEKIKRISGVNPDMLGEISEAGSSGIAIEDRIVQGQVTTEIIHDNFRYTLQLLSETLLDFVRHTDTISAEEIQAIVQEKHLMIDGQPIPPEQVLALLKDRKIGKYGIDVSLSSSAPTARLKNFKLLLDAAKAGLPIPPEILLKDSNLAEGDKKKIAEAVEAQRKQQAQLQQQEQTQKTQ